MKKSIILIVLFFITEFSIAQACGIYRIEYVGSVNSKSQIVDSIKLPTFDFFHGNRFDASRKPYERVKLDNNLYNYQMYSQLTSSLHSSSSSLLNFFKSKSEDLHLIIVVSENGQRVVINKNISWDEVEINKIEDKGFGDLFEINLGIINLK